MADHASRPHEPLSQGSVNDTNDPTLGSAIQANHGGTIEDGTSQENGIEPGSTFDPASQTRLETLVPSSTDAVGEPGLPPVRVSTNYATTDRHASTNTTSRTHIPSVTSRAFFSPMSSERLQAHRGQRPTSQIVSRPQQPDEIEENRSMTNRNSTGSVLTTGNVNGQTAMYDLDAMPPISHGTDFTEWSNAGRTFAQPEFLRSASQSERQEGLEPLQQTHDPPNVPHINGDKEYSSAVSAPDRSPRTFMANFKRNSGQGLGGAWKNGYTNGHEKLPSTDDAPPDQQFEAKKQTVKQNLGSNYEYYSGNTVFCWGGRLQNARDKPIVLITGVLFIVPSALFFGFSAPWLWHHVSPAIPIIYAYLFFICVSSYLHASLSDPGILPRNLHVQPPPPDDPWAPDTSASQWIMISSSTSPNGAFEVPVKYCKTCKIWRPPRCHHCRVCDSCIDTQDHHCMWLNNCVGRRNYRYFFAFVASGTLLGIYLLAASLAHVLAWRAQNGTSFTGSIDNNRVPFAMFLFAAIVLMYPAALWVYHMFLISWGLTTREYLNSKKFLRKDRHRPFRQKEWWKNFVVVLCRPRPPTYLQFSRKYEEGDQRFGERRGKKAAAALAAQLNGAQGAGTGHEMQQMGNGQAMGHGFQGPRSRELVDATPRDDLDPIRATSMGRDRK